ncbi:hypothetical protein QQS21_012507 [Conoideocrella luteorostrata]|uniref:Protein kinase domain-containing protein n=1 Tax=Conoideocrella luteorostrata TaxID=1105319 RepID=A0AAJ0CC66_9HYPO|nr:hypothetical protein QQS21_012507 [Conoideocrella luteorostrata]
MDGEQENEDRAIRLLRLQTHNIPHSVYGVHLSGTGKILSNYTEAKHDRTCFVHYPPLKESDLPKGVEIVRRNWLVEQKRVAPAVDVVEYISPTWKEVATRVVVFKYYFLLPFAAGNWNEMNVWMRLPPHPNIARFDSVVTDESKTLVVGFTSYFVSGGTLKDNKSRMFKFHWLQQLMNVADDLNLKYGISHQYIAPQNLAVDERLDCIKLFDFNLAARIHGPLPEEGEIYIQERNDVNGVELTLYEIITRDFNFRELPYEDQPNEDLPPVWRNANDLPGEWIQHEDVTLDNSITQFRLAVQFWKSQRITREDYKIDKSNQPEFISWPKRPKPERLADRTSHPDGTKVPTSIRQYSERRQDVLARNEKGLNWERLPMGGI